MIYKILSFLDSNSKFLILTEIFLVKTFLGHSEMSGNLSTLGKLTKKKKIKYPALVLGAPEEDKVHLKLQERLVHVLIRKIVKDP